MSRPTYGYGADDPRPSEPDGDVEGLPDLSGGRAVEPDVGSDLPGASASDRGRPRPSYGRPAHGASFPEDPPGDLPSTPGAGGPEPVGAVSADEPPTCPRHPGRVSYVRCQRCGRPACPECQRPASVGVLCTDCAHQLERQQRASAPRSAMGGGMAGRPVVTYTVMALCVIVFGLQNVAGGQVLQLLAFAPFRALAMPWTFITSGFLHGGVLHLLLNMYALYIVGGYLERTMGHWRYAGVYLLSIIGGHVAVLLLADPSGTSWFTPTVGASGGIFGLFGSMLIVNRRMGAETSQVLVLIGLNLVITFMVPNISWQGHLGGLVLGTALTAVMFAIRPTAKPGADRIALARRATLLHAGVLAAGLLLCVAIVGAKVATSPIGAFALGG